MFASHQPQVGPQGLTEPLTGFCYGSGMADFSAQVIIRTADAIPANYITNTFSLDIANALPDLTAATAAFKKFYDAINGPLFPLNVSQNGHMIKYVLRGQPEPNYPQLEQMFNLAVAPAGDSLPSEVALCLSFQAERIGGLPQARRQGRVYLGPIDVSSNTNGRPTATLVNAIAGAAAVLKDDIEAIGATFWDVYSTVNGTGAHVSTGWVDNAFDTQRRRGVARTSRTTWT